MNIPPAANALGTLGAICWSIQLLPQIIINHHRHHTTGLQPTMMLLWASAGVPLGVYNIVLEFNLALRIQAQILTVLSLVTWAQCAYYGKKWAAGKCVGVVGGIGVGMGAVETALVVAVRIARRRGVLWPGTGMAVLAAVLLAAGVLRHYWDIWTHRTVRGISFVFVGLDAAGDFFSLLSLVFQAKVDILGMVVYGTELALWIGIMLCGGYLNLVPWVRWSISRKRRQRHDERSEQQRTQDVAMHGMPSSTSVFRTPSSLLVERNSQGRPESNQ